MPANAIEDRFRTVTDPAEAQAVLGRAASAKTVGIALEKKQGEYAKELKTMLYGF